MLSRPCFCLCIICDLHVYVLRRRFRKLNLAKFLALIVLRFLRLTDVYASHDVYNKCSAKRDYLDGEGRMHKDIISIVAQALQ